MRRSGLLTLPPAFLLAGAVAAQGIEWCPSVEQGLREAKDRNAPILVSFIQDGEEANDRMVNGIHKSTDVIKLSRRFVCFVANRDAHEEDAGKGPDGTTRRICRKFGSVSCAEHRAVESWAFKQYTEGEVKTPQHFFCDPSGKVVGNIIDVPDTSHFLGTMEDALRTTGPGLDVKEYPKFLETLAAAEKALSLLRYQEALKGFREVVKAKNTQKTALAERARAGLQAAEEAGQAALQMADDLTAQKDYVPAVEGLERLAREFKGEPLARTIAQKLQLLRGNPEVAAHLKENAAELRAYDQIEAAERHLGKNKPEEAVRILVKVSADFPERPVGKRAAELTKTLETDPKLREKVRELSMRHDCENWLRMSAEAARAGEKEKAGEFLRRILENYPESRFAKDAQTRLKALEGGTPP